jgi:predicted porin
MKTKLLFTLLASASTLVCAQATGGTNVTVYGLLDGGITQVSGLRGGSVKQLTSGIMEGSRLGIRVNEDMGGGWRALVTLEHRLEMDTGEGSNRPPVAARGAPDRLAQAARLGLPSTLQPVVTAVSSQIASGVGVNVASASGNFWDRQIFGGLVTPVGAILAGRMYTPGYEVSATFDALGTQSALAFGQVGAIPATLDIRLSNAVQYRIVTGGITASVMVAAGEGSASTGRMYGGMVMYKASAFEVGVGYNTRENEIGAKSLTSTVAGVRVNLGTGHSLFGQYVGIKDDNPTGLSGLRAQLTPQVGAAAAGLVANAFINGLRQDATALHIGYKLETGPHTFYTAYNKLDDKRPANADTASFGVTYSYALSKRTDINAAITRFDNSGLGQAAPGGGGYLGGITASAGTDSSSLALGVRHRF